MTECICAVVLLSFGDALLLAGQESRSATIQKFWSLSLYADSVGVFQIESSMKGDVMQTVIYRAKMAAAAMCALLFSVQPLYADTYIAEASADASVSQMNPFTNYGNENTLVVGNFGGEAGDWWTFVKWDFVGPNKVPEGSTITSATIQLYQNPTGMTSPIIMEASFVDGVWNEGDITWVYAQPGSGILSYEPYAAYGVNNGGSPSYVDLPDNQGALRNRIQGIVSGNTANDGVRFLADPSIQDQYQIFRSREDTPPRLVIEYTPVPQNPDIAVVAVDVPKEQVGLCDDSFACTVTFENVGQGSSVPGSVSFRLGLSPNDGIYPAGSDEVPAMSPGETRTVTFDLEIDGAVNRQDYYIIAEIDVAGDENDGNDSGHTDSPIEFYECVDIQVSGVSTDMMVYEQADAINTEFTLQNFGSISSGSVIYTIVLSDDPILGNDDFEWAGLVLESLDPFEVRTVTQSVTLPNNGVPPGDYYIGVHVEDDGGFNDMAFTTTTIHINDFCLPADLVATDVSTGASAYSQGDTASIGFDVSNDGCMASEPSTFAVVFSTDQSLGPDDLYVEYLPLPALDGMQTIAIDEIFTIPSDLTPGEYYIAIDLSANGSGGIAFAADPISVVDCIADFSGDGDLTFFDVSMFIDAYLNQDPAADLTGDGTINFFDVSAFIIAYQDGCP